MCVELCFFGLGLPYVYCCFCACCGFFSFIAISVCFVYSHLFIINQKYRWLVDIAFIDRKQVEVFLLWCWL